MQPFQNQQQLFSLFENLEERVLFDGVPDATFILPQTDAEQPVPAQVQDAQPADNSPRELVLIDAGVENSQELLAGILESKPDATLEIRVIDGNSDGVAQISAILAESDVKYDAIHIISHGEEGEVRLGNTSLTSENLSSYADQLAGWSDALTGEADLLFYGCDLVGNEEGHSFVESIATITGADVAASDDVTGHASLGGDWDLEVVIGDVQATSLTATAWLGELGQTFYLSGDQTNTLTVVDPTDTNPATNEEIIGPHINAVSVEAIARDPFTGQLYGANQDELGLINQDTGEFTAIGNFGNLGGPLDQVNSLGFDPTTGDLYAVDTRGGPDRLFLVDVTTGAFIPNAFGPGQDFVGLDTGGAGLGAAVDDIAIDNTGQIFITMSNRIVAVDIVGNTATLAPLPNLLGSGITDLEGLSADAEGNLFGSTGTAGGNQNSIFQIDKTTGIAFNQIQLDDSDDYEALEAFEATADLEIEKTTAATTVNVGDLVTFTVTVTNTDPNVLAPGVEVTDSAPAGLSFIGATPSKGTFDAATGIWNVGVVEAGTSETINITYQVTSAATSVELANTAEITDAHVVDPDSIPDNGAVAEDDLASASVSFSDKDGDGVADFIDLDDDNDGILDADELNLDAPPAGAVVDALFFTDGNTQVFTTGGNTNGLGFRESGFEDVVLAGGGTFTTELDFTGTTFSNGTVETISDGTASTPVIASGTGGAFQSGGGGTSLAIEPGDPSDEPDGTLEYQTTISFGTPVFAFGFDIIDLFDHGSAGTFSDVYELIIDGRVIWRMSGLSIGAGNTGTVLIEDGFGNSIGNITIGQNIETFVGFTNTSPVSTVQIRGTSELVGTGGGEDLHGIDSFRYVTQPLGEPNIDGDNVSDHCDLDSDNDGISDLVESGADASVVDVDGDGVYDNTTGPGAQVDANGIPLAANGGVPPVDTDGDGIDDFRDLDSDNDGIPDAVEAFPTAGFVTNDGNVNDDDSDGDGVLDVFDNTVGHGANFTTPQNTDGTDNPDYIDTDSDNDGLLDLVESGLDPGQDTNGDGIADNIAPDSYQDPDGIVNNPSTDLANQLGDTSEVGYREFTDKDWDGVPDFVDLDSDNDGILDSEEGFGVLPTGAAGTAGGNGGGTNLVDSGVDGAFNAANVTFGISSTGPTTPGAQHILETITINGVNANVDGTYSDYFTPDSITTNFDSVTGDGIVREVDGGQFFNDINSDPNYDANILDAFQDRDLNHFQQLDQNNFDNDSYTLFYDTPIISNSGGFLAITERFGNNTIQVEALDALGASLGMINLEIPDYIDSGHVANIAGQNVEIALYPLDDIAPVGSAISSLVVTLEGNTNDGPDSKVFIFGDREQLVIERDTDGDGVHDGCDFDSDNDGISDLLESGNQVAIDADTNMDGTISVAEANAAGFTDDNNDGAWDQLGATPVDSDGDGIQDYLDLDSDNDGIPDAVEAQPTAGYQTPSIGVDADGDGVVDTFDDPAVEHGGAFTAPEDTDNDGTPDYLDTDSDNDGISDTVESGLVPGADTNGDGIADNVAPQSYGDTDGIISNPGNDLSNEVGDTSEVAYREVSAQLVTVKTLLSSDSAPAEGDTVVFQIEVSNDGTVDATNVSLIDLLPAGLTLTGNNPSQGIYNTTTGLWTIGTLTNGSSVTLTLEATVDVGQGGNTITNTTTAAAGDQPDPNTDGDDLNESVTVDNEANLVTVKTLASGDNTPAEGDTVSFAIEVRNDGSAQATNVSLTDNLPAGITFVSSSVTAGSYNSTTGIYTCLLYTSPSPRDRQKSRMPSSA